MNRANLTLSKPPLAKQNPDVIPHTRDNLFRMLQPTYDFITTGVSSPDTLGHRFHMRIVRCSSYVRDEASYPFERYALPYPSLRLWGAQTHKETYYSTDGIPRFVSFDYSDTPRVRTKVSINIDLRGHGHASWITTTDSKIVAISSARLSDSDVQKLIGAERAYLQDFYKLSVDLHGGTEWDLHECDHDWRDIMFTLLDATRGNFREKFQRTVAQTNELFPTPMLVPPSYPFSVPISFTNGCDRVQRCGMCTLDDVGGKPPTLDEVKRHIDGWARTLGHLTTSTQSVFLGRNNILGLPFDFLMKCLAHLKSPRTVDVITKNMRPELKEHVHEKVEHWGNIGRLSAFASVKHVLGLSQDELRKLRANGLSVVFLSLETGSDRIRSTLLGKNYSTSEVIEATRRLLDAGIAVNVITMFGMAKNSSEEHVAETIKAFELLSDLIQGDQNPSRFNLHFLFSPFDRQFLPPRLRGHTDPNSVLYELNQLGVLRTAIGHVAVKFDSHSGLVMELPNSNEIHTFPYHYHSLFV
ncbi:MAG: radical SAM protein [Candidatus Micrarchaeota archaeon]